MNPCFNLIDEPWIPVIDQQGNYREVGLRETLAEAHRIDRVAAPNGMETASILRLLLAVLHRTHDTSSAAAWGRLWQRGRFDRQALETYWARWVDRFDLFHPERPFYQRHAGRDDLNPKQIIEILPGITAAAHFNHAAADTDFCFTPAESARGLLVSQTFGTGIGCIPTEGLSIKASTWNAGMIFFVEGESLFQTLSCNLLRYDDDHPFEYLPKTGADRPNWEADDPFQPRALPLGFLDYLTWPSRRILLKPEDIAGKTVVRQFIDFVGNAPPDFRDPYKFYRYNKKAKKGQSPVMPVKLQADCALWRNSTAILRLHQDNYIPPLVLAWIAELKHQGAIRHPRSRLVGYGMVADKTKVDLTRIESIPLPFAYLEQSDDSDGRQEDLLAYLDVALHQAGNVAFALNDSIFLMAETLYSRTGSEEPAKGKKLSPEERARIEKIGRRISSMQEYWAGLEHPFNQLILGLPEAKDPEGLRARWREEVLEMGRKALAIAEERAGQYPKALKAGVLGRARFEWRMSKQGLSDQVAQGEQANEQTQP